MPFEGVVAGGGKESGGGSAFTMTGAPAMIRPPMIDSLPASVSPRRMAKPPPTTQIVPKMKPMIDQTYPHGQFVAIHEGRIVADAATFDSNSTRGGPTSAAFVAAGENPLTVFGAKQESSRF